MKPEEAAYSEDYKILAAYEAKLHEAEYAEYFARIKSKHDVVVTTRRLFFFKFKYYPPNHTWKEVEEKFDSNTCNTFTCLDKCIVCGEKRIVRRAKPGGHGP